MAYQTRQRDPFLDHETHAILVRRGQELLGVALLALGVACAALLLSYAPSDPNWMAATDTPPQNLLGRPGAAIAAIFMMILGYGAVVLPIALIAWGLRFVLHAGAERAMPRVFFLPIVLALASIYAASHMPPEGWTHSFGLGGLFGDTVLGAVLNALPMSAQAAIKVIAAAAFLAGAAMLFHVVGVSRAEFRGAMRFLIVGLVTTGGMLMSALRGAGAGAGHAAGRIQAAREARAAARAESVVAQRGPVLRRTQSEEPLVDDEDEEEEAPRAAGFFSRLAFGRTEARELRDFRKLEPELPERSWRRQAEDVEAPDDEQIRARISDAIRARLRGPGTVAADVQRGALAGAAVSPALRVEPPLTAGHATHGAQDDARRFAHVNDDDDIADLRDDADDDFDDRGDNIFAEEGVDGDDDNGYHPPPIPREELTRRVVQQPARKPAQQSRRAMADAQPSLPLSEPEAYEFPPLNLLTNPDTIQRHHLSSEALEENARMLESVLDDYGVKGEIVSVRPGPVVTMYELEPAPGLKASRVIGLADDIARSMSALSARVSTVPGRSVIGIELPNQHREKVVLREILASREFGDGTHRLPLALGKDIGGEAIVANLAKMPHLLIAGTTGSGKSVAINTMILSLLYKLTPEDCRMIMIDPKMLELSVYDGIPHLLSPVVTDPKKAVVALKWVVGEMEERYRKMSKMGVRNIDGYNGRVAEAQRKGEMFKRTVQTGFDDDTGEPVFETEEFAPEKMPFIVVIVDEMADLMMVAGKEIEACIQRLAQMARASGIHIIMATQRPSVDVITGTIKANFPTRISFHVTSKVDSRTILGEQGAEQLLGMGDMLYMAGGAKITRVHGPFVSDEEVEEIVRHLKSFGPPEYASSVLEGPDDDREADIDAVLGLNTGGNTTGEDALYDQAVAVVVKDRKCSTSYIQRKLGIGYNKAARLVEQMEEQGLVTQANHVGKREILVPEQE
jgi:DNA segregation ATPase FtsK/SpoIIIE, S-DNA-T family